MDQLSNDCPCKRQRVSEEDDSVIDQETGMLLDDIQGSEEPRNETERDCSQRETTVGHKGDSVQERDTTSNDLCAGPAGDSQSSLYGPDTSLREETSTDLFGIQNHFGDVNHSQPKAEPSFDKERNQSIKNIFKSQTKQYQEISQSPEDQSANIVTGSQLMKENAVEDVIYCVPDLNQSVVTASGAQSNPGFCEYVQNVQAIAENSYMKTREKNATQSQIEKMPKLESPKLKRPLDRITTNLVKKRMEEFPYTVPEVEELDDNNAGLDPIASTSHFLSSTVPAEGQSRSDNHKVAETGANLETSELKSDKINNTLDNSGPKSVNISSMNSEDSEWSQRVSNASMNKEVKSCNRTKSSLHHWHAGGLDDSGLAEMFSNSVMGKIMRGNLSSGSFKHSGNVLSNSGSVGNSGSSEHSLSLKQVAVEEKDERNKGKGSLFREVCSCIPEASVEVKDVKSKEVTDEGDDNASETCKFEGLGNLLEDIGQSVEGEKGQRKVAEIVSSVDACGLGLGTNVSCCGETDVSSKIKKTFMVNRDWDKVNKNAVLVGNKELRTNDPNDEISEVADPSEDTIKDSNVFNEEITEKEGGKKSGLDGNLKSTSSLVNGRFKLDFCETQEIINQNNINSLPITVLVQILKNLTVFELLRRASCVCRYWYNLCRDPDIWRSIYLVNQHRLSDSNLKSVIRFSDRRLRRVDLTDCRFLTDEGVRYLLLSCPQIEVLKIMRCFSVTDAAFERLHSSGALKNLRELNMDSCSKVSDKSLLEVSQSCPRLRILHLNQCMRISDSSVTKIAQNCPQLANLQLDFCSQVSDVAMAEIVMCCPEMLCLNLMCCGITDTGVKYLAKLSKLTTLDLSNIPRLTSDSVVYLSKFCKNLQCLNVSLNIVMDDNCVSQLAMNLPMLKRLYCVSCSISDKGLEDIAKYRPSLEALDVGWCQDVTDHGVRVISLACKHLDYFGLIRCDRVTIETMEELVLKYPRINFSTFILESRRLLERARQEGYQFNLQQS